MILIKYDSALVPEGGAKVFGGTASLVKAENKDAAGHAFHTKCLEVAGVIGNPPLFMICCQIVRGRLIV